MEDLSWMSVLSREQSWKNAQHIRLGSTASWRAPQNFAGSVEATVRTGPSRGRIPNMGVPANWPDHLEAAIRYINNRILPNLKYSPNDLLLTLVVNTKRTPTSAEPTQAEVET
jgi:hypothetical protein